MSKVLVVSDSHGLTGELEVLRARHLKDVDLMIHCGDSEMMPDDKVMDGYLTVRGNCDFGNYPIETTKVIAGRKFFITHGHKYSVKASLMKLSYKAAEVGANIVCFGHSHLLGAEIIGGNLFLNPGSIRLPRGRVEKTYMILDLLEDKIKMAVYDISGRELKELAYDFVLPKG